MKIIRYIAPALLAAALFSACAPKDNISIIPAITYQSFTPYADSAVLEINFQDGDGDIGYASNDASAPFNFWGEYLYQDSAKSTAAGYPVFSAFYDPLVKQPLTNDTVYFLYHIPDITPTGKDKALKGIIKVVLPAPWFINQYTNYPNVIEYRVWIVDRAGHLSNTIYTPPVNTQPY